LQKDANIILRNAAIVSFKTAFFAYFLHYLIFLCKNHRKYYL